MDRSRASPAAQRRRLDAGLAIVEVVVAAALFAILLGGISATVAATLKVSRASRHRVVAANLASRELDAVRNADFADLVPGRVESTERVGSSEYTIARDAEWVEVDASQGGCQANDSAPAFLRFTVQVSWPNMGGVEPVRSQTIVTPPVGSFDRASGHIAVTVLDRAAQPLAGVPVRATGPEVDVVQRTTETGCAFFGFMDAETYTVRLEGTDYVDLQGEAAPEQIGAVAVGSVTNLSFTYDRAAALSVTFAGPEGSALPASLGLTVANTSLLPSGTRGYPVPDVPVSPQTVAGLFPFESGYEIWAGTCADADPASFGDPEEGSVGSREPPVAVNPGEVAAVVVTLGSAQVAVTRQGVPVYGATLAFVHAADAASCTSGERHELGTTDTAGGLVAAVPYGTWEVQVVGAEPAGSWPVVTVDPTVAAPVVVVEVSS